MKTFVQPEHNVIIRASRIELGQNITWGSNITVKVRGTFALGDRARLGSNAAIEGRNVIIGADFYSPDWPVGLGIGRGRLWGEHADLIVGNRCTMHNSRIDLACPVIIGDDVGLSPDVVIYTHGYWLSVLEGFPCRHQEVRIGSGCIVGFRSVILAGACIGERVVIGAQSVVPAGCFEGGHVWAGNPIRKIRRIVPPSRERQEQMATGIVNEYTATLKYRQLSVRVVLSFPHVVVNNCTFDLLALRCQGQEDEYSDDFRDFVFRRGLRFYTKRPFRALGGS